MATSKAQSTDAINSAPLVKGSRVEDNRTKSVKPSIQKVAVREESEGNGSDGTAVTAPVSAGK